MWNNLRTAPGEGYVPNNLLFKEHAEK